MAVNKPEIHRLITKVNFTDSNRGAGQIKYLVKHYVGATGGAEANCKYFYNTYRGASAHFFVGHNGEIWQCVEENDTAWHCGAKSYKHKECRNSNSIGVELCVKKDASGNWYYTDETKKAAAALFAYLMDKYHIDIDHVLRHYDVTGKVCGEPDVRKGSKVWKQFRKAVEEEFAAGGKGSGSAPPEPDRQTEPALPAADQKPELLPMAGSYEIRTTCNVLNIRAGAGTGYKIVGRIAETAAQKKKYTIVEEADGAGASKWGRLKSGAGWIALDYTEKA